MMKYVTFLFVVILTVVTGDFYSAKYDNFDIQPLLENEEILQNYIKCFLEQGSCTPEGEDFKKVIPEALETSCAKCTPKQKQLIRKVIRAVMERDKDSWDQMAKKFDKDSKYKDAFNKFIGENE